MKNMSEELEIDASNFDKHFFDVRRNKPSKGDVIACYRAMAEFVRGNEKKNILDLLIKYEKAEATAQVMRKLLFASEQDAYRVPKEMAEDLINGMSEEEVMDKPYKYTFEAFYYTNPENIPMNDPHWTTISLINPNQFLHPEEIEDDNLVVNGKLVE